MEPLTLKRLAIKYRLHPLAVEDALSLESRPKVEIYDSHLFLVVPGAGAPLRLMALAPTLPSSVRRPLQCCLGTPTRMIQTCRASMARK